MTDHDEPAKVAPAPTYVTWLVAGFMLAMVSGWPVELDPTLKAFTFIGACVCGIVAVVLNQNPALFRRKKPSH